MTTFSQICDALAVEHLRPDLLTSTQVIPQYLNQTIRDVHLAKDSFNGTVKPVYYESNRLEDEWTVATLPAVWSIPSVPRFQTFETAYFSSRGVYAEKKALQRTLQHGLNNDDPYWYRSGGNIVFNGCAVAEIVRLSYFEYPRALIYYPVGTTRPCTYSNETDTFTYAAAYDVNDATRENARNLTINWLLYRWEEVMKQGVRAKVFSRLGEQQRSVQSYSLFEMEREGLRTSEEYDTTRV